MPKSCSRLQASPWLMGVLILWNWLAIPSSAHAETTLLNSTDCAYEGKPLYGKVQIVDSFPDLKVQVVESFPDLKVQMVHSFPDQCGKWQVVESFPDLKIQFVESFPDLKIQYVDAFPGLD